MTASAGVPVAAEVTVGRVVFDDVPVGVEDVVAGRADRFQDTAPAADLGVVGCQVGVLTSGGGVRGLGECYP